MSLLESKNPLVRKGTATALQLAKFPIRLITREQEYAERPPIIVNSLPKSGTHLLLQLARAIPETRYLGGFIAHAWSVTLHERSPHAIHQRLGRLLPGEVTGAHIKYHPETAIWLQKHPIVHLFIYRDPRDVILSEEAYVTEMAPWHRLHRVLRRASDREERLRLLIEGVPGLIDDIRKRVRSFTTWLKEEDVISVRYEDLAGDERDATIRLIAERICRTAPLYGPPDHLAKRMEKAIAPERSHTFREGGVGKWRTRLPTNLFQRIMELAGNDIVNLGYPEN